MLNAFEIDIPDFFADLPMPRARRRVAKSKLRANRLARRNALVFTLAADRTGTGRGIARAVYRDLRRAAAGASRSADSDGQTLLDRRFLRLNGGRMLSEGAIRNLLASAMI